MTPEQLLLITGLIFLAPHYGKYVGVPLGLISLTVASLKGLGWL